MEDYLLSHIQRQDYGTLHIEQPKPPKRRKPGSFAPGHPSYNKGRKWDEWMAKDKQEIVRASLRRHRCHGNPNWVKGCKAHNAVEVVAFRNGVKVGIYKSATAAAVALGLTARNVRHCAAGKRRSCGGYVFFRRDDREAWLNAMITHQDIPAGYYVTSTGRICPLKRNSKLKSKL